MRVRYRKQEPELTIKPFVRALGEEIWDVRIRHGRESSALVIPSWDPR